MHGTRERGLGGDWKPVRLESASGGHWALHLRAPEGHEHDRLMITADVNPRTPATIESLSSGQKTRQSFTWLEEVIPERSVPCGMTGTNFSFYKIKLV
jgi:hypothetical protein